MAFLQLMLIQIGLTSFIIINNFNELRKTFNIYHIYRPRFVREIHKRGSLKTLYIS